MITMPRQVFDALKTILFDIVVDEWLESRVGHFAGSDERDHRGYSRYLMCAGVLVEEWCNQPTMTPDDIRDCLEQANRDWERMYATDEGIPAA
jgi:hypothetical protein